LAERAVPILPSRDLAETQAFYERLGFENRGAPPDVWDYLIIGREGAELHFFASPDLDPSASDHSCYLYVGDADAVHREWEATGTPGLDAPDDTPYGMREFALVDPSGNLVRVGSG
jgi:catechol 2,3-dioxygenase-like lactoylglutathione lyase family enzyme